VEEQDTLKTYLDDLLQKATVGASDHGQRNRLLTDIRESIYTRSIEHALRPGEAVYVFQDAIEWVDDLQRALNPLCRNDEASTATLRKALGEKSRYLTNSSDVLFPLRNLVDAISKGERSEHYWSVDLDGLSECTRKYLTTKWAPIPWVEQMMAQAFVFQETLSFVESVRGRTFLGAMFGRRGATARSIILSLLQLAVVIYVFFAAAERFELWVGIIAGLGTYRLFSMSSPVKHETDTRLVQLSADMASVYQILGHDPLAPALIRERLIETAHRGAVWPAGLFNLIDAACKRNSSVVAS
jgi:hypothetical protein